MSTTHTSTTCDRCPRTVAIEAIRTLRCRTCPKRVGLVCEFCFARAAHQSRCLTCEEAAS